MLRLTKEISKILYDADKELWVDSCSLSLAFLKRYKIIPDNLFSKVLTLFFEENYIKRDYPEDLVDLIINTPFKMGSIYCADLYKQFLLNYGFSPVEIENKILLNLIEFPSEYNNFIFCQLNKANQNKYIFMTNLIK